MSSKLEDEAVERSSYAVTLSGFVDAVGTPVTPTSLTWTLSTKGGAVINSRSQVTVTPAASVVIVLSDDDLAFQSGEDGTISQGRVLTVEGTYNSTLGVGLSLREEYHFRLRPLVMVS